jgi:hypothetical protein
MEPELTPTLIGLIVIALIYLSRWLWDYNRARREDAEQHEPRANPPLHTTYASKQEHAELKARVDNIETKIDEGFQRLDAKRSSSVAGLHDDLEEAIEALRLEVKNDIGGVQNKLGDVLGAVAELRGRVTEALKERAK